MIRVREIKTSNQSFTNISKHAQTNLHQYVFQCSMRINAHYKYLRHGCLQFMELHLTNEPEADTEADADSDRAAPADAGFAKATSTS